MDERATKAAETLKKETATAHQALENIVLPKLQAIAHVSDYAALLKGFYGYFLPVEKAILKYIRQEILPDIAERRKAAWLAEDIVACGQNPEIVSFAKELPVIQNRPQALGALYVLEGSTLGGRSIVKMLKQKPALQLFQNPMRFFSGYDSETGSKWISFLAVLNSEAQNPQTLTAMVQAANETFFLFKKYIHENQI